MNIDQEKINKIINDFNIQKKVFSIDESLLYKINKTNPAHNEFYSYLNSNYSYYLKFLKFLIENIKPKIVVELGNREGLSTICIYDAIRNIGSNFYTVDIIKDQRFCPDEMFKNDKVHFLFGDVSSYEIVKKIPRNIDFLFSDTIHYKDQIEDEFEIYQHLLSDTALVAIDDIKLNDKGIFFDKISYPKWDLTELCHSSGWGLFLYRRKSWDSNKIREEEILKSIIKVWERKFERERLINSNLRAKFFFNRLKAVLKKNSFIYRTYTFLHSYLNRHF